MNRKPADELADIRAQIKILEVREEELRAGFILGNLDPDGDDHIVVVETKVNERIDGRSMRKNLDEAIWRPYLIATPVAYVKSEQKPTKDGSGDPICL
ncbi:hypothetical protein [Bradyrhizobium japonicum]|uniref:hypothetical protein n=1 Tax=Bradyrhizobium japonicum TaxID=375 RepID=UPI001BA9138A|nr:hypothetical protein [Bradyrhizobium japonicum]MBR0914891.1 hypothetical protein [Bradyrhizobium japonicum]